MSAVDGAWSRSELESFLTETTVPLRLAVHTPSGRPWIVPLWFVYNDGVFQCATGADAGVVELLTADPTVGFDVSTNDVPYRGARGHGRASIEPDTDKALLRELLNRYLGGTDSTLANTLLADDRDEVRIAVDPDRLVTWDYATRMQDA